MWQPRPKQQEVLEYTQGKMGVAAVPGSGKTWTLSMLAAKLIMENQLADEQEILVVTLVNSAVDNFEARIRTMLYQKLGINMRYGYRVRTLHSLCNEIVRERPSLVGLSEDFTVIDEREASGLLAEAAHVWVNAHPKFLDDFIDLSLSEERRQNISNRDWVDYVTNLAANFIKLAKDLQLTPADIQTSLDRSSERFALAEMGLMIYRQYERGLGVRGAVDFQDLIRLALKALQLDHEFLGRLQRRYKYILEDEAQDSSRLQEEILRHLAGGNGNWVRVGDPNQAIYETFTTARPEYLWQFVNDPDVISRELPNSGRSAQPIIDLANYLIEWTRTAHPSADVRAREPLQPPYIQPAPAGDPQPNPPAEKSQILLLNKAFRPSEEVAAVIASLQRWLPQNPDKTVAILTPRNTRGFDVVDAIKQLNDPSLPYVELLRSTTSTREAAGVIGTVLSFLSSPKDPKRLARVYRAWRRDDRDDESTAQQLEEVEKLLSDMKRIEDFIAPQLGQSWFESDAVQTWLADHADTTIESQLRQFRELVSSWLRAVILPIDQLILLLAQDLFHGAADLAIAHSIAVFLRQYSQSHRESRLPDFTTELAVIAKNERKFIGMDEESSFDPDQHKGKVTIATMHSAKGLEWDRVYLMSVNNYDFPSAVAGDQYISEKYYVRDSLNLDAEAQAQLKYLADVKSARYQEGNATLQARVDYAAERLRLLYVGITRAREDLIVTYNTGRWGNVQPSIPFVALQSWQARGLDHDLTE